jgi:hypothetical protein
VIPPYEVGIAVVLESVVVSYASITATLWSFAVLTPVISVS